MIQKILAIIFIIAAVALLIYRLWRSAKGNDCGCGCGDNCKSCNNCNAKQCDKK
ncbi:MAG: FeoB-associated Cys-rich membrane protein [Bacteroidales bacterium]|nr:FeoB-associated Cys-rich membrane protein [Bacteroidales bacterium]MBP5135213.1 FeoB-associated Cys-rich membrane protein [Paludibacteraceae bacterium]